MAPSLVLTVLMMAACAAGVPVNRKGQGTPHGMVQEAVAADGKVTMMEPGLIRKTRAASQEIAMVEVDSGGVAQAYGNDEVGKALGGSLQDATREAKIEEMLTQVTGAVLGHHGDPSAEGKGSYFDSIKSLVMSDIMPDLRFSRDSRQTEIKDAIDNIKALGTDYMSESSKVPQASEGDAQEKETLASDAKSKMENKKDARDKAKEEKKVKEERMWETAKSFAADKTDPYEYADDVCNEKASLNAARDLYDTAEGEFSTAQNNYTDLNEKYVVAFLTYQVEFCSMKCSLDMHCENYEDEFKNKTQQYEKLVQETKELDKKWRAEYDSLEKILCYISLWLSDGNSSTVDQSRLAHCNGGGDHGFNIPENVTWFVFDYGVIPQIESCKKAADPAQFAEKNSLVSRP
jgi:hypothetical protein